MIFQQINRSDAEKVFGIYYNASSSTMAKNSVAQLDCGASQDGNRITTPTTAQLDLVIGIVDAAISSANFGLVQIYGYRSTSAISNSTASGLVGDKLVPIAGQTYLSSVATGDGRDGHFAQMSSFVSSSAGATNSVPIFIRAM